MNIAFVTGNYPSPQRPTEGVFVQQFIHALARQGHEGTVVRPTRLWECRYGPLPAACETEDPGNGRPLRVLRPRFLSFSSRRLLGIHTGRWTQATFNHATVRILRDLRPRPDIVYGHFLYQAGRAAVLAGAQIGAPAVVSVGEGTFWTVEPFGFDRASVDFRSAAGFIAVASHIRHGLLTRLHIPADRILLEPNGVNLRLFQPGDRTQARAALKLPPGLFLIAFVGAFDDLKGGTELVEATRDMEGVGLLMMGQGPRMLQSSRILFRGPVPHADLPRWLAAADIFVLPTREEGSCNAVLEAMACGLPIVTSNGHYMNDIVDDAIALRVPPTDIPAIRNAIGHLMRDPSRRQAMSAAALVKARQFDIDARAARVSRWMAAVIDARQENKS